LGSETKFDEVAILRSKQERLGKARRDLERIENSDASTPLTI